MSRLLYRALPFVLALMCASTHAAPSVTVVAKIAIGGAARWNNMGVDSEQRRLYLAHDTQIDVIDLESLRLIGTVAQTQGARAVAIAPDLGVGYASNGASDTVTVFDLKTLTPTATIAVGNGPDAVVYDGAHQRMLVFNARSQDVTVIDARAGVVIRTEPLGAEPETAVVSRNGLVYLNVENTNELVVFDPASMVVTRRQSLLPCRRPTALAIDALDRLYSACRNGLLMLTSADGHPLGNAKIGRGADGVVLLDGLAYSADGGDGTLSIVRRREDGTALTVATVPTAYGSRTLAVDPVGKHLILPVATFSADPGDARPHPVPGSLSLWILAPR